MKHVIPLVQTVRVTLRVSSHDLYGGGNWLYHGKQPGFFSLSEAASSEAGKNHKNKSFQHIWFLFALYGS